MKRLLIALAGLGLLSAACVQKDRFRHVQNQPECFPDTQVDPVPGVKGENRAWASLECRHTLYTVGFIEFDDDGRLIDPVQEAKALSLIEHAKKTAPGGKVITLVYVHGWRNNASEAKAGGKPKDVEKFESALLELGYRSRLAARQAGSRTPIPIVGIYMGWRGKSLMGPDWFTFASFWGRRNTANRVGSEPAFAQSLNHVIDKVNEGETGSRVMLVGHSFGARVLEHAIEQQGVRLYQPVAGSASVQPLVDLTLYVNSANDARLSMRRVSTLRAAPVQVRHPAYDPKDCQDPDKAHTAPCRDYPLLVAITSRGDLATKYLLRIANTVNLDKGAAPDVVPPTTASFADDVPSAGTFRKRTAAHMPFLHSHVVREVACPTPAGPAAARVSPQTQEEIIKGLVEKAVAEALGKEDELKAKAEKEAKAKALAASAAAERLEAMLRPVCQKDDAPCRFVFRTQSERPLCFQVDQRSAIEVPNDTIRKREPFNTTAFWIMDVDQEVIDDHGDIWNVSFVEMLGQLMAPRGFFEPDAGRIQLLMAPGQ
jgi:pimeloyl-ACP methyl ester carboxylesterase